MSSPATQAASPSSVWRSALACAMTVAFATCAAMWTVGYTLRFPGLEAPGPALGVALLGVFLAGCALAGRLGASGEGAVTGLLTGVIAAAVNLLVLGSLAGDLLEGDGGSRPNLGLMVAGWMAFGAAAGWIAGWVGGRFAGAGRRVSALTWASRFAVVTALAAFFLLIMGGVVTSAAAGLAVPDWPNTFGSNMFLFPLSRMTGDIYLEHAHRLYGSLVGLMTLALTGLVIAVERRGWVKWFSGLLFLWVCGQGLLGGLRVTGRLTTSQTEVDPNDVLGMVHGVTGQVFVAMLAALALVLGGWGRRGAGTARDRTLAGVAVAALVVLLVQIALGAGVRHFNMHTHTLIAHVGWSVVAAALVLAAGFRTLRPPVETATQRRLGKATLHSLGLQMALGVVALGALLLTEDTSWKTGPLLALRTAHQSVGALLLVVVTMLAVWARMPGARGQEQ